MLHEMLFRMKNWHLSLKTLKWWNSELWEFFPCQRRCVKWTYLQSTLILMSINFPTKKGATQILLGPPLSHRGQARQSCPKLTSSSCAKVHFFKRYPVKAEKHQGIDNSPYSQHDTERSWTKHLGSTPGDQMDQKKTDQKKGQNCIQLLQTF